MKSDLQKRISFLAIFFFAIIETSFAEPFIRIGQGIRNIGMGNTGIALSHDESALFYNPAGLARVENAYGSFNFLVGASDDLLRSGVKLSNNREETENINKAFSLLLDQSLYIRALSSINLLIPIVHSMTFGAAIFADGETLMALENAVLPKLSIGAHLNEGQAFGISLPLNTSNSFILGIGARVINRRVEIPYTTFTLAKIIRADDKIDSLFPKGTQDPARGVGGDMGFQWRIPGNLQITIGGVAQNIGQMKFLRKAGNKTPRDRPMEISFGVSMQPSWGPFRLLSAVDIRDATMQSTDDNDIEKRIHSGSELGFLPIDSTSNFISIRGGLNQGYGSFGFEINPLVISSFFTIQYAIYGEELGKKSGDQKSYRSIIQVSLKLGEILL